MNESSNEQQVRTRFTRSNFCRIIHADGAWGAITGQLNIHMALFSEHRTIPTGSVVRIAADGTGLSEEPLDAPEHAVTREVEVEVIMSEATATSLRDWLNNKLLDIETAKQQFLLERGT